VNPRPRTSPGLISEPEQNGEKFNLTSKAAIDLTLLVESKLQIVHALPGRIRLRTNDSRFNSLSDALSQQLKQQEGISEVSVNQETGSLLVKYDREKMSLPQIFEILKHFGVLLPGSQESEEKTELFAAWRSLDFWQEQGRSLIPLVTGLLVTGKLGLHGLSAIPAYLIAASATRQVIEYLDSESTTTEKDQISQTAQRSQKPPTAIKTSKSAKIACSIVHAIPGRVRFHVPLLAQNRLYAQRLEALLKADERFKGYRINRPTANLVITYEPGLLPDAQMCSYGIELIQLAGSASPQAEPNVANGQATVESGHGWAELKHPALAASLAYMANLPL